MVYTQEGVFVFVLKHKNKTPSMGAHPSQRAAHAALWEGCSGVEFCGSLLLCEKISFV